MVACDTTLAAAILGDSAVVSRRDDVGRPARRTGIAEVAWLNDSSRGVDRVHRAAHLKENLCLRARLAYGLAYHHSSVVAMVAALVALLGGGDLRKDQAQSHPKA